MMSQGFKKGSKHRTNSPAYPFLVAYLTIPSNNWDQQPRQDNSIPCMAVQQIYRETDQLQEKETS